MILVLLLLAVPAAEIFIFIEVGGIIGAWPTVGLIFVTAILGGTILRIQGLQILARAREQVARSQPPVAEIVEGAGLVLAAVCLLTPGFFTDAVGAILLVPPLRRTILRTAIGYLQARGTWRKAGASAGPTRDAHAQGGPVIEGEYTEIEMDDDPNVPPPRGSWKPKE